MAKPEWGLKRICLGCGARFYDMKRDPIHCPKCDVKFDPTAVTRPRRSRAAAVAAADAAKKVEAEAEAKAKAKAKDAETDDEELDSDLEVEVEDSEDDSLIEDTSDLDEDDDVSGVIEGVETAKPDEG